MLEPGHRDLAPGARATIGELAARLRGRRVVALTGAGCSTESGIPDYRGPETARRARNPIQFRGFVSEPAARERYWARSFAGWPKIRDAVPNAAHHALAALEAAGVVRHLITQNVDRLHHKAGSRAVTELHGALTRVRCLGCGVVVGREALQARLVALNGPLAMAGLEAAPDGDADLGEGLGLGFHVAACEACGAELKPDVVFFGESVPRERVDAAERAVDEAEALLVVGSSLAVYSGLRFVRRARERGLFTSLVNLGPPARGLEHFELVLDGWAGPLLSALCAELGVTPAVAYAPHEE